MFIYLQLCRKNITNIHEAGNLRKAYIIQKNP